MLARGGKGGAKAARKKSKTQRIPLSQLAMVWFVVLLLISLVYYSLYTEVSPKPYRGNSYVCHGRALGKTKQDDDAFLSRQPLQVSVDAYILPNPSKAHYGGEDAMYVSPDHRTFAVADGVGGWNLEGVNPREFSTGLMVGMRNAVEEQFLRNPLDLLCHAEKNIVGVTGSCTVIAATIDGFMLKYANLGDSGLVVFRGREIAHKSKEQQHEFNFPFQLGSYGDGLDVAEELSVQLLPGDVIVMGSDGLFDNLSLEQLHEMTANGLSARAIASQSMTRARSATVPTPFSRGAQAAGQWYTGGKVDDITVVVAVVTE
eukprot:TRINITY_DN10055_c0_g1_i1.p1 TRINITY_DN10055_c0_g1~~TRINITY_DN10055_c0_g1_i1.p1  ORF type:complete len:316 (+),score=101.39 TRINITY_DN10055_c0_g1_i1:67-1014(+)